MTGLLFLAFAFFAVAKAGAVRGGGQSAADAAALAAAQDDRDQLFDGFLDALGDGDAWQDWLAGDGLLTGDGCGAAADFAGRNDADVLSCEGTSVQGHDGYTVRVRTRFDTGSTIVPGTAHRTAQATATAVITPRCDVDDSSDDLIGLACDGGDFTLHPGPDGHGDEDDGDGDGGGDGDGDGEDGGGPDGTDGGAGALGLEPSDLFSVVLVG